MRAEAFIREGFDVPFEVVAQIEDVVPRLRAACAAATGRKAEEGVLGRL